VNDESGNVRKEAEMLRHYPPNIFLKRFKNTVINLKSGQMV
jgi:hypothetical protein